MNKEIMNIIFPKAMENVDDEKCPLCGEKINMDDFKDKLSKKEFKISGICQKCQDEMFV